MHDNTLYPTDDIIIGLGEVPARGTGKEMYWVMPGNKKTFCRDEAINCAINLDRLIRSNIQRIKDTKK